MSMLSGLAEYIFGSAASAEDPSVSDDGAQGSRPSPSMQITYADDDWVLVDVTSRLSVRFLLLMLQTFALALMPWNDFHQKFW